MATFKPTIREDQVKSDGTVNIRIRVNHNGKVRYLATDYFISKEDFDKKSGKINTKNYFQHQADDMNLQIQILIGKCAEKLRLHKGNISRMDVNAVMRILRDQRDTSDLHSFLKELEQEKAAKGNVNYSQLFKGTQNMLIKYLGSGPINLESMTPRWLRDLEMQMRIAGHKSNYIGIHMRNIRTAVNKAIIDKAITRDEYPFAGYKIPREKQTERRNLPVDQFRGIANATIEDPLTAWARDMFMLSFYLIGINMKDLFYAKHGDIEGDRLYYVRSKGGREHSIKVFEEAKEIIQRHQGQEYLLNTLEKYSDYGTASKRINYKLKDIAEDCKIGRQVSTYYARHSWATIARNEANIPRGVIAEALAHGIGGSDDMTGVYIQQDLTPVDWANRKVIDLVTSRSGSQQKESAIHEESHPL